MSSIYRQLAHKLRWHAADGSERLSERPREGTKGRYLDLPPAPPTLVRFALGDRVDVGDLVRIGAIAPYTPPAKGGEGS